MFLIRAALLAAQPLRRRRGTEVGAAIAPAGAHRTPAWTGSAKAATTAGPRAAEPTTARSRSAKTPTAAAAGTGSESSTGRTRRTIFARPRLADRKIAPLKRLCVKPLDDLFRLATILELHEGKATRTSGLAIDGHDYMGRFGNGREVGAKVSFAGPVGKVPDEQTDSQGFLVSVGGLRFYPRTRKPRLQGRSYMSCSATGHWEHSVMTKPRVLAGTAVLALVFGIGCNRTQTSREAEQAAVHVKSAAAQAGDKLADGWLTSKIQAQFFADEDVKSRFINVRSRDGVVTLKGFVESDDARRQVLEIARNTDGVKEIDDRQLLVGRPVNESFEVAATSLPPSPVATSGVVTPPSPSDPAVVTTIQAKFFLDPALKTRNVDVQAANGVVTLKGSVASETERAQALSLARSSSGVQRVEDYLVVDAALQ